MGSAASFLSGRSSRTFKLERTLTVLRPDRYHKDKRYDKYRELPEAVHPIWAMAIAEVNLILAAASADNSVHLWDLASSELRVSLKAHGAVVWAVQFSPNESTLATASADLTIRLWEADTGTPMGMLRGHTDVVKSISFSPDGILISGSLDCHLAVWEFDNIKPIHMWKAHENGIHAVTFSPADPTIALSIGADGSVAAWRAWEGEEGFLARFPGGDGGGVISLAAHPTRVGVVATGIEDGGVWLWYFMPNRRGVENCVSGHHHCRGHTQAVWALDFSLDGTILASASSDCNVRVWGVVDQECPLLLCCFQAHDTWVRCVRWIGGTSGLASASTDGTISFWYTPKKIRKYADQHFLEAAGADLTPPPEQEEENNFAGEPDAGPEMPVNEIPALPPVPQDSRPDSPKLNRGQTRGAAGLVSRLPEGGAADGRPASGVDGWSRPEPPKRFHISGNSPMASPSSTAGFHGFSSDTPKGSGPPTGFSTTGLGMSGFGGPPTGMTTGTSLSGMSSDPPVTVQAPLFSKPPPPPANARLRVTSSDLGGGPQAPNYAPPKRVTNRPAPPPLKL